MMATFEQRDSLARRFHEAYERLAPEFGYKTREASAVPWEDVPQANKELMRAVAGELIDSGADLRAKVKAYAEDRARHAKHPTLNTVGSARIASDLFQMLGLPYPEGEADADS